MIKTFKSLVVAGLVLGLCATFTFCKKPPGPGGKAAIKGKIYVKDFDAFANLPILAEYYGSGETVYICYGTDQAVGGTVHTGPDGSYEFLYLRPGHYKIFANSRDTSLRVAGASKVIPVVVEVDITSTKQVVTLSDIIINK